MICSAHRTPLSGQTKEDVMGGACGTYGGEETAYRVLMGNR
jgi:hypothetical protein